MNYNVDQDIAVLKLHGNGYPLLTLGDSNKIELGESIVAISSPLGMKNLQNTVSTGIISNMKPNIFRVSEDTKDIQMSTPIIHGSSGGALFNMKGQVIGITYGGLSLIDGENLNLAIPINEVKSMIKSSTIKSFLDVMEEVYSPILTNDLDRYLFQNYSFELIGTEFLQLNGVCTDVGKDYVVASMLIKEEERTLLRYATIFNLDQVKEWINEVMTDLEIRYPNRKIRVGFSIYNYSLQKPIGYSDKEVTYDKEYGMWVIAKDLFWGVKDETGFIKINFGD